MTTQNECFTISNTTNGRLPRLPFLKMKEYILGKKHWVGLVCVGDARSKTLNNKLRGKDKPANVLTFPLTKNEGEIYINPRQIKRDARSFGESYTKFFARVFIHALLHLKGCAHSSTMDKEEETLLKKFKSI